MILCSMVPRVVIKHRLHWDGVGSNLTLKNDPTCISALGVVMIYKTHWNGIGSNFNVEK